MCVCVCVCVYIPPVLLAAARQQQRLWAQVRSAYPHTYIDRSSYLYLYIDIHTHPPTNLPI